MNKFLMRSLCVLLLCAGYGTAHAQYDGKHEWRAVWIATVNNIDWPSAANLTSEQQKKELIAYMDLYKRLGFNSIVFQVRPAADAFYASKLEPWSIYLNGKQGKAPNPFYDPLAFLVAEAHKRGMELHAWLNPYRMTQNVKNLPETASEHIYKQHPEWFTQHGQKSYFDPALPQTREFLCKVAADIVRRYDVDGIHLDDYFYPNNDFKDDASFTKYNRGYAPEDKMAWRRENVDIVVKQLRDTIKSIKPFVKFGISPYAVWRNKREDPRGSDSQSYGYTNYDHLHADVLKWMEEGWIDYILPQLYFHIGHPRAEFTTLANWWADNCNGLPVYAGLGTYRLDLKSADTSWRSSQEIAKQIEYIRAQPKYFGACYFSAKNFKDNKLGINEAVKKLYNHPALVPALPGFETKAPETPAGFKVAVQGAQAKIIWDAVKASPTKSKTPGEAFYYAVYRFKKGETPDFSKGSAMVYLGGEGSYGCTSEDLKNYDYYLTALDRLYNESEGVKLLQKP